MRTAFLGTSDFAVAVLGRLAASRHRPLLVVTRPDLPRGRGRRLARPPVAEAAAELGIEVIQPESVNDDATRALLAERGAELLCVCAFGALIREPLLSAFELLNVHPSLLPRWRGAAPIERAIEAGDERTGVTIMRVVAELDAGPICLARDAPIRPDDDYGSLAARLASLGGELLVETLERRPPCREQPAEGVTYAEKLGPADRRLDPSLPATALERRVRALHPHIGAWVELAGGERLAVHRAAVVRDRPPEDGRLEARGARLLLGAGGAALELLEVQPPGGRRMAAADYLRGHAAGLAGAAAHDRMRPGGA